MASKEKEQDYYQGVLADLAEAEAVLQKARSERLRDDASPLNPGLSSREAYKVIKKAAQSVKREDDQGSRNIEILEGVKKMKNKKVILSVLAIALFLFYWYEWRPSQIVEKCNKATQNWAKTATGQGAEISIDQYEHNYKICLRKYGLRR